MKKLITVLLALFVLSACGEKAASMVFQQRNDDDTIASLTIIPDYETKTLSAAYRTSEAGPYIAKGQFGEDYFTRFEEVAKLVKEAEQVEWSQQWSDDVEFRVQLNDSGESYAADASGFQDFPDEIVDLLTQAEPV